MIAYLPVDAAHSVATRLNDSRPPCRSRVTWLTTLATRSWAASGSACRAGIRPNVLLLDRGFLQRGHHLLPAGGPVSVYPAGDHPRAKTLAPQVPSGTRVVATGKRSGWSSYTLTSADHRQATVGIGVHCRH